MNAGHFSYLLQGSRSPQTKVGADRLEMFAKTAAKHYLQESKPLNDSIAKIAKENDLNRNQIERVCEMANIETHRGLWQKTAQKEKIAFPLADSKVVVACACGDEDAPPDAPSCDMDSDYAGPPKGIPGSGPDLATLMGVDPDGGHNGLAGGTPRQKIIIVLQKKAAEREAKKSELLLKGMELETLEKKAYAVVKQAVLGGYSFRQVYDAACGAGLAKVANEYLPKFQDRLIGEVAGDLKQRLQKHAIAKAPEELISENLGNINIVNGAHPVLVSLDTVNRKTGEIRNGLEGLLRIDDQIKVYNQQLRDLS